MMVDMNEIRAKRLARITQQSSTTKATPPSSTSKNETAKKQKVSTTTTPPPAKVAHVNSSAIHPDPAKQAKKQMHVSKYHENIDEWTAKTLQSVLRASLSNKSASANQLFWLNGILNSESLSETSKLSYGLVDSTLLEVLTEQGVSKYYSTPFDYLFDVWSKADAAKRVVRSDDPLSAKKLYVLREVIRLSSSYAAIMFQVPDMFVDEVNVNVLVDKLWRNISQYEMFLMDITERAVENDTVVDFLNALLPYLTKTLRKLEYSGDIDYLKIISVIQILVGNRQVAAKFHEVDGYHPKGLKGSQFEKTILGSILRISPLLPELAVANYPAEVSKATTIKTHESLQAEHNMLIGRLFSICDRLVRSSKPAREAFLSWLADAANSNHLRCGEHARRDKLASDSLMLNLTLILVKFSQPFLAAMNLQKLNSITMDYMSHTNRMIDLSDETRINSTIEESNKYYTDDKVVSTPMNFISQCFYLLLTYIHYGLGGLFVSSNRLNSVIKELKAQINKVEEVMKKKNVDSSQPYVKMFYDMKINPLKKELQQLRASKLSLEMFYTNRNMQLDIFEVIIGSITFFMKLIDPTHKFPESQLKVPLHDYADNTDHMEDVEYTRNLAPVPFKYYPEMFLEGIIDYCHFISKFTNNPMFHNESMLERFVEFAVLILRCPELVSNPHLKARLTEVLFFGSLPMQNGGDGYMIAVFNDNKIVKENLMVALVDFYVVVEKTGASSQFYDKFNSRYHMSYILEKLWKFDYFRQSLKSIAQTMPHIFIRLIARMLNDTTYLLDESLNHLHTIGTCQREIAARQSGKPSEMPESDEDLQKKLVDSERMAMSFVQLSNKTVLLFDLFTQETPRSFVIVEIVDRLAGMLDYNLVALVGPKYNELKVKNPEKYRFDPGELLFRLCSIFNNLSPEEEFVDAVARDERSFKEECFKKAVSILYRVGKVPNQQFETKLLDFAKRANNKKVQEEEEEEELGEVPDEFLDPLMCTLMKDPVKLPHSNISIDRSVIKAHLMNDPTDPFNRTPLKIEDVKEDVELRDKIRAWVKKRKAEIRAEKKSKKDNQGDVVME